jgi:hypothetical protein
MFAAVGQAVVSSARTKREQQMSDGTFGFRGFKNRAFEIPAGVTSAFSVDISPGGRARLRYNDVAKQLEQSIDGGAYTPLGGTGAPWDQVGTDVFPDSTGWNVAIGAATVSGTEKLRVVGDSSGLGGIRIESNAASPSCFLEMNEGDASSVSAANEGRIIYSESNQRFEVSENTGAYVPLGGGSGWTDDGGVVRLTTAADQVGIGTATMTASEKLRVLGAAQFDVTSLNPAFAVQAGPGGNNFIYVDASGAAFPAGQGIRIGNDSQFGGSGPDVVIESDRLRWEAPGLSGNAGLIGPRAPVGAAGQAARSMELFGGPGGTGSGGTPAANGGTVDLYGGDGGVAGAVSPSGLGGNATLRGGDAGALGGGGPGNLGGDALIHGGAGSGGVADGKVVIGGTTTSRIDIGNAPGNPATDFLGTGLVNIGTGALAVGATSLLGSEKLRVVGDVSIQGDIDYESGSSRQVRILQAADDTAGDGMSIDAGQGGNYSAGPVGAGGQLVAAGGDGGDDTSVAGTGGAGGAANINGGIGGAAIDGGGTGGVGGNAFVQGGVGGASGGTQGVGGTAYIRGGTGSADGDVLIGDVNTARVIIAAAGNQLGFFGAGGVAQPTVVGAKGGNAALGSLLTALAALGLVIDSTTP